MRFNRKLGKYLDAWRLSTIRKPLIIRGARQVGKSTLIAEHGKSYTNFITLNLEKSADRKYFENYGDDVKQILEVILLEKKLKNDPGNTLLFIDEIQEVPKAIQLLRYFYEDIPSLHVVAAGSLLELVIKDVPSFPVGRVQQVVLHPMDFEEFLEATSNEIALEKLREIPFPDYAFDTLLKLFNEYIIIGGMPEVVKNYVDNNFSLSTLSEIYSSIWDNYKDDVEKYSSNASERNILRHIVEYAPTIRDRITFAGFGGSNYRSGDVSEAFHKLDKSRLIKLIYPTTSVNLPIQINLKRKPKIQFLDTGLMNYASGIQANLLALKDFNNLYKGYIVNHVINQELIAHESGINYVPRFWVREKANSSSEVDLVIQHREQLVPVEIKSGASGRLRSLHEFMERTSHDIAIRFLANKVSLENISTITKEKNYRLLNLPYFCVSQTERYMDWLRDENG